MAVPFAPGAGDGINRLPLPQSASVSANERMANGSRWLDATATAIRPGLMPGAGSWVISYGSPTADTWYCTGGSAVLVDPAGGALEVTSGNTKSEAVTRPASGTSRYDVLALEPVFTGSPGVSLTRYAGTAAASPTLISATNQVSANGLIIGYYLIANSGAPTITQSGQRTVAPGGVLPVATLAELNAIGSPWDGMRVYQEDADLSFRRVNGAWRGDGDLLASNSNDSALATTNNGAWGTLGSPVALSVTFTAPAGGQVEVYAEAFLGGQGQQAAYGLRLSGGTTRDPLITEQLIQNAPTSTALSMSKSYLLTGLTPGTSYTLSAGTFTGSAGLYVAWQRARVKTA